MNIGRWLAPFCLLPLAACATIIHGSKQSVPIVSRPTGAEVTIDGKAVGQTPVMASLSRKGGQLVRIELTGFQPFQLKLKRRVSPAAWWNAWFYFASLPIDLGTGGLFEIKPGVLAASLLPTEANRVPAVVNDPSGLWLGARVRLKLQGDGAVEGVFLEQTADSFKALSLRATGPLSVPMSSILQVDKLGPSRHRHTRQGAVIGAGAGAVTGALFVGMLGALFAPFGDNTPTTGDYLGGAAIFGLGGAAWGAFIGSLVWGESWEPVPIRRTALQPLIGKSRVGLALQIRH